MYHAFDEPSEAVRNAAEYQLQELSLNMVAGALAPILVARAHRLAIESWSPLSLPVAMQRVNVEFVMGRLKFE